jgi:hypothetical protein
MWKIYFLRELFNFITKSLNMKKIILAAICGICIFGSTIVYSQDSTKAANKGSKAMKKEDKGKHKKAVKKTYKMEKKEAKDK